MAPWTAWPLRVLPRSRLGAGFVAGSVAYGLGVLATYLLLLLDPAVPGGARRLDVAWFAYTGAHFVPGSHWSAGAYPSLRVIDVVDSLSSGWWSIGYYLVPVLALTLAGYAVTRRVDRAHGGRAPGVLLGAWTVTSYLPLAVAARFLLEFGPHRRFPEFPLGIRPGGFSYLLPGAGAIVLVGIVFPVVFGQLGVALARDPRVAVEALTDVGPTVSWRRPFAAGAAVHVGGYLFARRRADGVAAPPFLDAFAPWLPADVGHLLGYPIVDVTAGSYGLVLPAVLLSFLAGAVVGRSAATDGATRADVVRAGAWIGPGVAVPTALGIVAYNPYLQYLPTSIVVWTVLLFGLLLPATFGALGADVLAPWEELDGGTDTGPRAGDRGESESVGQGA